MGALTWGFFAVILTMFTMDFLDTIGTLIGVSARANLLDEDGNLPEVEKPMLADALATVAGALLRELLPPARSLNRLPASRMADGQD